ncbi:MAG TPA: hypothetical protein VES03_04590 [Motilibacterales bacterium]|nr:hypothetical protein [Motilibacterales bacterium]
MSADPALVVGTSIGVANVLHRLVLGVECLDAVTEQRVRTDLAIGRELDHRRLPPNHDPQWPCVPLLRRGTGRGQLLYDATTPTRSLLVPPAPPGPPVARLRLVDPWRRFVARRLDATLWTLIDVVAAEAALPTVRAAARQLRPWLWPGTAARLPQGMTAIRGAVQSGTQPVRWARLTALRPTGGPIPDVVGHGHSDDRGEFVVVIVDTGTLPPPPPKSLQIDLLVIAPDPATAPSVDPDDAYADLVVETVGRASNPPLPAELDNDVLRGTATPPGYVANTAAVPTLTVPVGAELFVPEPIPFAP